MNDLFPLMLAAGMRGCHLSDDERAGITERIERQKKADEIRRTICGPHCIFSRTCSKDAEVVFACSTVAKYRQTEEA